MNKNNKMITCYNMGQPSNEFEPYTQNGGVSPTLLSRMGTGGNQIPIVHCYDTQLSDKAGALNCMHDQQAVMTNKTVRRLTPLECERLMGLPDYWTDVEMNGKPAPDSKRYKAIGNGMAVPCSTFIMRRIAEVVNCGKMEKSSD